MVMSSVTTTSLPRLKPSLATSPVISARRSFFSVRRSGISIGWKRCIAFSAFMLASRSTIFTVRCAVVSASRRPAAREILMRRFIAAPTVTPTAMEASASCQL